MDEKVSLRPKALIKRYIYKLPLAIFQEGVFVFDLK